MIRNVRCLAVSIALATAATGCTPKKSSSATKSLGTEIVCDIGNNWWLYMLAGALHPAASAIIGTTLAVANSQLQKNVCNGDKKVPPTIGQIAIILRDDITQVVDDSFRDETTALLKSMQSYNPAPVSKDGDPASTLGDNRSWLNTRMQTTQEAIQHFEGDVDQLDRWALAWTLRITLWKEMISVNVDNGNKAAAYVDIANFNSSVNEGPKDLITVHLNSARQKLTKKATNFFESTNRQEWMSHPIDGQINIQKWCRYVYPLNSESNTYLDSFTNQDDAPLSLRKRRAFEKSGPICDDDVNSSEERLNKSVGDKINELSRDLQKDMIDNSEIVQGLLAAKADAIKSVSEMYKKISTSAK